jgi:UDP-glucuronate decarboxylase
MHPHDGRVVSNFIVQALQGEDITIYGDGLQTRSFCYVDDLIEGLLSLMRTPDAFTGPMNLGNPTELSVKALAEHILCLTGSSSKIIYKSLPADDPVQRRPDITKANALLSWKPAVSLADGLSKTIAYFRALLNDEASCSDI